MDGDCLPLSNTDRHRDVDRNASTPTATATPQPTATPSPTASQTPTPGPTPDGVARTLQVPILMYHYISAPPAGADIYRRDLSVTPALFESHLKYLTDAGYHAITLDDLLYALAQGRELPAKPVILTFDDGYEDNYTNAFPLLQKYNMVGHFFIISDFVNQERPGYMTWPQIEEMAAAGQRFGSHSRDHPKPEAGKATTTWCGRRWGARRRWKSTWASTRVGFPIRPGSTTTVPSPFTSPPAIGVG